MITIDYYFRAEIYAVKLQFDILYVKNGRRDICLSPNFLYVYVTRLMSQRVIMHVLLYTHELL